MMVRRLKPLPERTQKSIRAMFKPNDWGQARNPYLGGSNPYVTQYTSTPCQCHECTQYRRYYQPVGFGNASNDYKVG